MLPPGSLHLRRHGDSVAVVLDEEQQRQALGGRDIERRPETIGGRRCVPAVRDRDAARAIRLAQGDSPVAQRLRPADGRGVLGAYAAAHRQRAGAIAPRQVEHNADIAALAHAARAHHGRGERLLDRKSQGEEQGPGAVVPAHRIPGPGELAAQEDLGDVVAARRELVEHLALRQERALLEIIERARDRDPTHHGPPVRRFALHHGYPVRRPRRHTLTSDDRDRAISLIRSAAKQSPNQRLNRRKHEIIRYIIIIF